MPRRALEESKPTRRGRSHKTAAEGTVILVAANVNLLLQSQAQKQKQCGGFADVQVCGLSVLFIFKLRDCLIHADHL
jgi:hypothetical protein